MDKERSSGRPWPRVITSYSIHYTKLYEFSLGEPDGEKTERVTELAWALTRAGLKVPVRSDIRTEIWVKLLGNMTFVITSYSIHYTKLYESSGSEAHPAVCEKASPPGGDRTAKP